MPKPSIIQMLETGKGCGLSLVHEAYENYMMHHDLFFLLSDYGNQLSKFNKEFIDLNLDMNETIEEGIKKWEKKYATNSN